MTDEAPSVDDRVRNTVESSQALLVHLMETNPGDPFAAFTTLFGAMSLLHLLAPPWARSVIQDNLGALLESMKSRELVPPPEPPPEEAPPP